ncbi:MAG TPA: hypothetical protein VN892_17825 [Solirubrobacteraceae bacterium]|nr:hypothetical protein [Solirubrobacteraceae bacterium]
MGQLDHRRSYALAEKRSKARVATATRALSALEDAKKIERVNSDATEPVPAHKSARLEEVQL